MLFKFTSPDILNSALLDIATGQRAYCILTIDVDSCKSPYRPAHESQSVASTSSFVEQRDMTKRRTTITNSAGKVIASIDWTGRCPDITIGEEHIGPLTELFGTSTTRFIPKVLIMPTRFDTEYFWTASEDSLVLFDDDAQRIRGAFHYNSIRIPLESKVWKFKTTTLTTTNETHCNSSASFTSSSTADSKREPKTVKSTFISTHTPGFGSNYLEFDSHPLADDVEIIISFLMMEIVRRGRFFLPLYEFGKPRLSQFKEAGALVLRRLRRNTV